MDSSDSGCLSVFGLDSDSGSDAEYIPDETECDEDLTEFFAEPAEIDDRFLDAIGFSYEPVLYRELSVEEHEFVPEP